MAQPLIGVSVGATAIAILAVSLAASQAPPAAETPLQRYSRGEYAALSTVQTDNMAAISAIRRDVKSATAISPQARATFLLEIIDLAQHASGREMPTALDEAIRGLFVDGCELVGTLPAGAPLVSLWYRAAVSVLVGGRSGRGIATPGGAMGSERPGIIARESSRFRSHVDPGVLALARTLSLEMFAWTAIYESRSADRVGASTSADFANRLEDQRPARVRDEAAGIKKAIEALHQVAQFEGVRPEAMLREAALVAAAGRPADAVPLFDQLLKGRSDDWVTYLAHLLRGRALEALLRSADAEIAYRAALALRPGARSASLAVAALRFARGERDDGALAVVFGASGDPTDPWAQFGTGDYRSWPARRDELRRAVR